MQTPQQTKWQSAAGLALAAFLAAASSASAQLIITTENQNSDVTFTPTWTVPTTDNLIYGLTPSDVGNGNFKQENAGGITHLNDGIIGPVSVQGSWINIYATCGNNGGASLTYTLPDSPMGYNVTNITVYSGWGNNGRDAQAYNVSYSTKDNPTSFISLAYVAYNPSVGNNRPSINRSVLNDLMGGAIAKNVYAVKFTFNAQNVENGYAGYSELVVEGTPATAVVANPLVVAVDTERNINPPNWTVESNNLIAGQLPTAVGSGDSQKDGVYGVIALTDGALTAAGGSGINDKNSYAALGSSASGYMDSVTYALPASQYGYDLTNVVTYSGWQDGGLDGQFYTVSYSSVVAPTVFVPIATICINPTRNDNNPMANRVNIHMANGAVLATNVAAVKYDFAPQSENGRCYYSEFVLQGTPSLTPSTALPPPTFISELPASATAVAGDKVKLTATFDPSVSATYQWKKNGVDIPGANSSTLTLNNVQVSDSAYYQLKAANASDASAVTLAPITQLTVTSMPQATNNLIILCSAQTGFGGSTDFTPTWDAPASSLIAGQIGTTNGLGNFNDPDTTVGVTGTAGGVPVLTDGSLGSFLATDGKTHPTFATCGAGSGGGQQITYVLGSSPNGYEVTNIEAFGGWNNAGRDEQKYTVRYSTVAAPTSFNALVTVDFNPSNPNNAQSMTHTRIVPATGAILHSVYAIMFDFNMGGAGAKNGYEGYSELIVGGTPTLVPAPIMVQDINVLEASDVVGSQITLSASFSGATSLQWKKNGTNLVGATSSTLNLNNLQLTDSGVYMLVAVNAGGTASSRSCTVTVNPVSAPVNNVITAYATQDGDAPVWTPSWVLSTNNSLIAGQVPSAVNGSFNAENQAGDRSVDILTAGGSLSLSIVGTPNSTCSTNYVTAGNNLGSTLIYTLGGSANGYDLTNIVTFGGWADRGRDQQAYTVYYSTVANPAKFIKLAVVNCNPNIAAGLKSAVRTTMAAANGIFATHVGAVMFDFTSPGVENGYTGYRTINLFGAPTATPSTDPIVNVDTQNQNTSTPDWNVEQNNLIAGLLPAYSSDGAFAGSFNGDSAAGGFPVLTDGTYGPNPDNGAMKFATCGGAYGAGTWMVYTCPNRSWTLTNIVVYSGWGNYNRDGQFFDIYYTTTADPTTWIWLQGVEYNPAAPAGVDGNNSPSSCRVAITALSGVLASNVTQVKFDFSRQTGGKDNGYSGYSEIVLEGSVEAGPSLLPVVTAQHQEGSFSYSVEPGSLIAGKLPDVVVGGATGFTGEGCNVTNLTDGVIGFGAAFGASCGGDPNMVNSLTFKSTNGWNLSNIVVYTLWSDYGRDGQFYNLSYSTLADPTTFLPLVGVAYNPNMPHGVLSANRVSIAPAVGQTMLASNVAALKFDFTPQGNQDYAWSGYSEIVLLGTELAPVVTTPTAPTVAAPRYSTDGKLIMTGTGGTANAGYNWLSTTNLANPVWVTNSTGVLDGTGSFSNAIPVDPAHPAMFFRLQMQ